MTGKGLTWTAAHLRSAASTEDVRTAIDEARGQLGGAAVPAANVLALLEELALEGARMRTEVRAATRVRELLLASVAHDLRNPLNTFAMSAGLLRDDLEGPDFDRSRALSLVSRMERATSRMQALIEDLLEASRIEAGAIELSPRPVKAAELARGAIAKAAPICSEKGATVEEAAIEEESIVQVDRSFAIEAITRLVLVALKTTGEGGSIRVGVERHEEDVLFTIRATGPRGASLAPHDESRGGLGFLIGRGLLSAQGGRLLTESTQEGPRMVAAFPAK